MLCSGPNPVENVRITVKEVVSQGDLRGGLLEETCVDFWMDVNNGLDNLLASDMRELYPDLYVKVKLGGTARITSTASNSFSKTFDEELR